MNRNCPPESLELVTVDVVPVQSFVTPAVEVPPGTPARPRPDRPPLPASVQATGTNNSSEGRDTSLALEEALQASKSKDAFLASMTNELRTPLNVIIGYAELLMEEAQEQNVPAFLPDLKRIHQAGKHLLHLINDILDRAKIERSPSGS